jgi:hypothetical protein
MLIEFGVIRRKFIPCRIVIDFGKAITTKLKNSVDRVLFNMISVYGGKNHRHINLFIGLLINFIK